MSFKSPTLVVHADWSVAPGKRWFSAAHASGSNYRVQPPRLVGSTASLVDNLVLEAGAGPVLLGFDFPIGVPAAYAKKAGIHRFGEELLHFGSGRWASFYELAETSADVSLARPFYPRRPGGTSRAQLVSGLGLASFDELLRRCERAVDGRPSACALFWTLGGNQVGRASIAGWRDVLVPALAVYEGNVSLWPFDGDLDELLARSRVVIAETYPAAACRALGMTAPGRGWSKRRQADRRRQAAPILEWFQRTGVEGTRDLAVQIEDGFGADSAGEDRFDAVIGLLSMLEVALGLRQAELPDIEEVRHVEGWILGQAAHRGDD